MYKYIPYWQNEIAESTNGYEAEHAIYNSYFIYFLPGTEKHSRNKMQAWKLDSHRHTYTVHNTTLHCV
jgi:hypothetical protein